MQRLSTVEHGEYKQWPGDTERYDPNNGNLDDSQPLVGDMTIA